jgi:adenylate cyclase
MTVYFSDVAGMTSIAESMPPDQLVHLLSRYFDEMTQVVAALGGTVDKLSGRRHHGVLGRTSRDQRSRAKCLRDSLAIPT